MGAPGNQPTATPAMLPQPPAGMGYDDTGTLRPQAEIRTFGSPAPSASRPPSVPAAPITPQPAMRQSTQMFLLKFKDIKLRLVIFLVGLEIFKQGMLRLQKPTLQSVLQQVS